MVVFEVGVISRAGLPVIHVDFRPGVRGDPLITAGFLTALQQFVKTAFSDETQSFSMKKFSIFFSKVILIKDQEEASVYVICDYDTDHKVIQQRIYNITKRLKETFPTLDDPHTVDTPQAKEFQEFLIKEFADLKMRPAERARRLFG
ncbi:MAG: hypothetical protein ACFFAJ_00585 [Candidatus Hodarchaeota archaeon]